MTSSGEIVGRTLGHFRVEEQIGAGGMGVVYRARDEHLDRDVALKVLPAGTFQDAAARKRFRAEALALSKLNHPNIETVHDFDTEEGVDFLIIEHIPGTTLDHMLTERPLPERDVVHLGQQLAEGVAAAHDQGIVHRDLKPSNLRVTPDRRLKILDFGLARSMPAVGDTGAVTESRAIVGTLPYMAPEQVTGGAVDTRTDVWGIGVVLYEMITGRRPFDQATAAATATAILTSAPASPTRLIARISPGLEEILSKCLEKDPDDRYHSAREIAVDLRRMSRSGTTLTTATPATRRSRGVRWRLSTAVTAGLVLLAAGAFLWSRSSRAGREGKPSGRIESLAVLPLANLSRDPDQEFFSDGMTDALITELAQIQGLRVISRTSAMQYKGVQKSMPQIAKELKVEGVVEGSVQRSGGKVEINVQLIDGPTDRHLWARSYARDLRDVLTLQREIARAIATEIRIRLTAQEQERLSGARPVDPRAHEAYLKGFFHARQATREGIEKGMGHFREALSVDPNYAPAHAGLAFCYVYLGDWYIPNKEVFPRAKEAASRALELDPSSAEARITLGAVRFIFDHDWAGAEEEFRRAIDSKPGSPDGHFWYGLFLGATARREEGSSEIGRGLELDPLSLEGNQYLGLHLYYSRRYEEAIARARRILDLEPTYFWAHMIAGQALEQLRRFREAAVEFDRAQLLAVNAGEAPPEIRAGLARAAAFSGTPADARKSLAELANLRSSRYVPPYDMALVHLALGENETAIDFLEKAREDRNWWMPWLKVEPRFDPLRSEPRFQALLARMKYPG